MLAGLGGVGLASAGAGLGTSAFLNDTESFEGNTITAGELDLKVDWEEHYSYPQWYGFDDPTAGLDHDVHRMEPDDPDFVPFPDPENPMVWIHEDDVEAYMDATAIEAFPDPNYDGSQELNMGDFIYKPCDDGADLDADLTPRGEGGATRTKNADTWVDGTAQPLVNLQDVKPGDFGELTLSFHLCDNPGYVWLQAANVSESEHGITEPEGEVDDTPEVPELAENIQTAWWYDDGDNVVSCQGGSETLYLIENVGNGSAGDGSTPASDDGPYLFDVEISGGNANLTPLTDIPDRISAGHIAATPGGKFVYVIDRDSGALAKYDVDAGTFSNPGSISGHPGGVVLVAFSPDGRLYMASNDTEKLYTVDNLTTSPTANEVGDTGIDVSGADIAFTSDGTLYLYSNSEGSGTLFTVDTSTGTATEVGETGVNLTGMAVRDAGTGNLVGSATNPDDEIIVINKADGSIDFRAPMLLDGEPYAYDYGDMTVGQLCSDNVFHRGTLASDLEMLADGNGIPLDGVLATEFDELTGDPTAESRECFQAGVSNYVGFAWWLPTDVGNEIQGDSVSFDLGFYTEQCRNNDGSGPEVEAS
jgi:predicted ribosomally synthesized peptide with SipW-like signal peptide